MTDDIFIGCRLCLCTEPQRDYFSLESSEEFLSVKIALSLKSDFTQLNILPNHICENCKDMVGKLQVLKTEALVNEVFIMKCQASIKCIGLAKAKRYYELKNNYTGFQKEDLSQTHKANYKSTEEETFLQTTDHDNFKMSNSINDGVDDIGYPRGQISQNHKETPKSKEKETFIYSTYHENFEISNSIDDDSECTKDRSQDKNSMQIQEGHKYRDYIPRQINEPGICIICQEPFLSQKEHDLNHHDEAESIQCPSCGKVFVKTGPLRHQHPKSQARQHIKYSHGGVKRKIYQCTICPKRIENLKRHMKDTHGIRRLHCTFTTCKKTFKSPSVLKRHIDIKHLGHSKMCPNCGKNVGWSSISVHRQQCSPSEDDMVNRTCSICRRVLAYSYYMKSHMKTKHGEGNPAIPCHICGKLMITQLGHDRHMHLQHTEEGKNTRIECMFGGCYMVFKQKQNMLSHHKNVHLKLVDKKQCNLCGDWLMNLDDHMKGKHKAGQTHTCKICGKVFYSSYDLRLHRERVHEGIRYVCPECGQRVSKIKDHLKSRHGITEVDVTKIDVIKTKQMDE